MLPQEVAQLMGKMGEVTIWEVEKGAIKKFACATGDSNPLYRDEEYARNSRYGSIIAPPGFFGWPAKWEGLMPLASKLRDELFAAFTEAGYGRIVDGGIEYDFFYPVRAGDILSVSPKIIDIRERETKGGKMFFSTIERSYINQNDTLVAKDRQTFIFR